MSADEQVVSESVGVLLNYASDNGLDLRAADLVVERGFDEVGIALKWPGDPHGEVRGMAVRLEGWQGADNARAVLRQLADKGVRPPRP